MNISNLKYKSNKESPNNKVRGTLPSRSIQYILQIIYDIGASITPVMFGQ
jgi:hypothetical protein